MHGLYYTYLPAKNEMPIVQLVCPRQRELMEPLRESAEILMEVLFPEDDPSMTTNSKQLGRERIYIIGSSKTTHKRSLGLPVESSRFYLLVRVSFLFISAVLSILRRLFVGTNQQLMPIVKYFHFIILAFLILLLCNLKV